MNYRVHLDANMTVPGTSKDTVRERLIAMIRESGFSDKDFELGISPMEEEKRNGQGTKRSHRAKVH